MAEKKLNILVQSMDGAGHINACIGLSQALAKRGHKITFLTGAPFSGLIKNYGFEFVLVEAPPKEKKPEPTSDDQEKPENPMKDLIDMVLKSGMLDNKPPLEKMEMFSNKEENFFEEMYKSVAYSNTQIAALIEKEKPDLIIVDNFLVPPVIVGSNIPYIMMSSGNPLMIYQSRELPPFCSGYAINGNKEAWDEFYDKLDEFFNISWDKQNKLMKEFGYPEIQPYKTFFMLSKYMNIYGYPEELDYNDIVPRPDNCVCVDAFCRKTPEEFKLPDEFKNKIKPGDKLIYFSLGSMGSFSVPLMQSVISVLAKTTHKYIVSKGPLHEQYQLPENMWGEAFLPQTAVLPLVDLVITHGGNNTVTETFCNGKPMIVMPLFGDQYDNAQRIEDKGFGYRINPFEIDENKLIESIDKLLFDTELNQKLRAISQRIETSNSKDKACIAIEKMVEKHRAK